MSEDEIDTDNQQMAEQVRLLTALHEIAQTSEEADTVREAVSALTSTNVGLSYLIANPLKV